MLSAGELVWQLRQYRFPDWHGSFITSRLSRGAADSLFRVFFSINNNAGVIVDYFARTGGWHEGGDLTKRMCMRWWNMFEFSAGSIDFVLGGQINHSRVDLFCLVIVWTCSAHAAPGWCVLYYVLNVHLSMYICWLVIVYTASRFHWMPKRQMDW